MIENLNEKLVNFKTYSISQKEYKVLQEFQLDPEIITIRTDNSNRITNLIIQPNYKINPKIIKIPDTITNLSHIKIFTIIDSKNEIKIIFPESIGRLKNIDTLAFQGKFIKIPNSVQFLKNLRQFGFSSDLLLKIPEWIGNMKTLNFLSISSNEVSILPKSLANLENLKILSIYGTIIEKLPIGIGKLKNLKKLSLKNNKISYIPESIGDLENLEILELNDNKLQTLPKSLFQLRNLKKLHLNSNQLDVIPKELGGLESLKIFELASNNLYKLPESIFELKNLAHLDISNNENFTNLPKSLKTLKNVDTICIESTLIRSMCNINFIIDHTHDGGDTRHNKRTWIDYVNLKHFTDKGCDLYFDEDFESLKEYYKKTTMDLALQLINSSDTNNLNSLNNPDVLNPDEKERLIHEATWREREVLEKYLDYDHPILHEINEAPRFKIKLKNGEVLRK